jgi:hypothetical protein
VHLISDAQVRTKIFKSGIPSEFIPLKDHTPPEEFITATQDFLELLNRAKLQQLDSTEYSNQFALPVEVNLNVLENAKIIDDRNISIYFLTITAERALNVSIQFGQFVLTRHAILSIYTKYELTDSITSAENNNSKVWATRVYQGNKLNIVLKIPKAEKDSVSLIINRINFGYKQFGSNYFGNPGASASCNVNVLCPQGNGWQSERNSVALIVANGSEQCTGALIMNTCNTNIPYLLTANHCLDVGNVNNWVFQFQYWSATCTPNSDWNEDVQFNGCNLRANNAASDFALLQLNQTPPANSGITFSGWSRVNAAPPSGVSITHPRGDVMKIATYTQQPTQQTFSGSNDWNVVWASGTVEPGSSGGPLYNNDHRIIGQVHGGNTNNICTANDNAFFGRFDLSWTGGGTNTTRLSNWLDPAGTNATTTNTTNVAALVHTDLSISGDAIFCGTTSNQYTIPNLPAGASVTWSVSPATGIAHLSCTSNCNPTLTKDNNGVLTLTATITNICGLGAITIHKTVTVGSPYVYEVVGDNFAFSATPPSSPYPNTVCTLTSTTIHAGVTSASGLTWSKYSPSGYNVSWSQSGNNLSFYFFSTGQQAVFKLSANNTCGSDTKYFGFHSITCGGGCGEGPMDYSVSPNPSSGQLVIVPDIPPPCDDVSLESLVGGSSNTAKIKTLASGNVQKAVLKQNSAIIKSLKIMDVSGRVLKIFNYVGTRQAKVNVSCLNNGIYFLVISNGITTREKKIIVQH